MAKNASPFSLLNKMKYRDPIVIFIIGYLL